MSSKSCDLNNVNFHVKDYNDNASAIDTNRTHNLHDYKTSNANNNKSCNLNSIKYCCEYCDYSTDRKSSLDKHILTRKHISNKKIALHLKFAKGENINYTCKVCFKEYKSRPGLWNHNKTCKEETCNLSKKEDSNFLLLEILKQNDEFKKIMIEQNKQILEQNQKLIDMGGVSTTNNINNTNNTMNNKFNLNFFLNETCKDAMNIQEFIDFCKVEHADFENFGKYGYVESMTRIIMRNLMQLEVHRRPIHCTDAKREVLYVKDNNVWVNDFSREKLIRAIKYIAAKNVKQIPGWMDQNPDSKNTQTKLHDKYMRMVCHSMGGRDEAEDQEYYKKIIRNVSKEVVIDKWK